MEYAGVGKRAIGAIIDLAVLVAVFLGMAAAMGEFETKDGTLSASLNGGPFMLYLLIAIAYFVLLEAATGATIGKLATGIRVVKVDGSKIDFPAALVRNLLRVVDGFAFYLVAAIVAWNSPMRQRLGDMVAKTVVVPAGRAGAGATATAEGTPPQPPPPPLPPPA